VGDFLISNIKKDVIRIRELVGSTYTEQFVEYEPTISSFALEDGVYVNKVNASTVIPLVLINYSTSRKICFHTI
jgi:hypothetical protein